MPGHRDGTCVILHHCCRQKERRSRSQGQPSRGARCLSMFRRLPVCQLLAQAATIVPSCENSYRQPAGCSSMAGCDCARLASWLAPYAPESGSLFCETITTNTRTQLMARCRRCSDCAAHSIAKACAGYIRVGWHWHCDRQQTGPAVRRSRRRSQTTLDHDTSTLRLDA